MNARAHPQRPKGQDGSQLRGIIERVSSIDLVGNIRAIREARDVLNAMLAAAEAELLGKAVGTSRTVAPSVASVRAVATNTAWRGAPRPNGAATLAEGSAAFWAAEAIRRAGRPLTKDELLRAIEENGHKVKIGTLVGTVYRWIKAKRVFYLAGTSKFGLIDMRGT